MVQFNFSIVDSKGLSDVIEQTPVLRFTLTYPLTNPYVFHEIHEDGRGWTKVEFIDAVRRAYETVYATEAEASAHPGQVPNLYNRATSNGPYGIWGHEIDELFLEGAERLPDGMWSIQVGS